MADGAGWFADPSGKINTFRWWDGRAWTRWLSADPSAPDPGPVLLTEPPAPDDPSTRSGHLLAEPVEAPCARPRPADPAVALPAAAAILVGGVLLAIIAVGAIISLTADRPLTGPAVAPPDPTEAPLTVVYDSTTRRLSVQELQVTMPGKPFSCDIEPRTVPGAFTSAFGCTAWVHLDYNPEHDDWVAITGIGILEESLRSGPDLAAITNATFSALAEQSYDLDDVTVKKKQTERLTGVAPDGKAVLVSAEMHVADKELPTTFDRMLVAVFELESGRHAAYFAIRPDDSKKDVVEALRTSAGTVTARK